MAEIDISKFPENKPVGTSGDHSGKGRQRRDDGEVFPAHRSRDEMGLHGGPKHRATGGADDRDPEEGA